MARFKELRQIEGAIQRRDKAELQWAMAYCKMRLQIARRKDHQQYWRGIDRKVREALSDPH